MVVLLQIMKTTKTSKLFFISKLKILRLFVNITLNIFSETVDVPPAYNSYYGDYNEEHNEESKQ